MGIEVWIALFVWLLSAFLNYKIAQRRGARTDSWTFIGLVLGPIGVLWALLRAKPR